MGVLPQISDIISRLIRSLFTTEKTWRKCVVTQPESDWAYSEYNLFNPVYLEQVHACVVEIVVDLNTICITLFITSNLQAV